MFYPGEPAALERVVDGYLSAAGPAAAGPVPKALIAPHAGYAYSGPVAGSAYAQLATLRSRIERVVLLGPSHRVPLRGLAAPTGDAFSTPLGPVPLDRAAIERALELPQVIEFDAAHAAEHSLEVHLPFLQRTLDHFRLAPFVAGDATADEVAELLEQLWGGDETLVVVSSDLSHYFDYDQACRLDHATTRAIETLDPAALDEQSACGRVAIRGLLVAARRRRLACHTLDVRSSGDTAGPRDQVVGYGAYAFA
jgi:AmmeMemoRadiSam system protein B